MASTLERPRSAAEGLTLAAYPSDGAVLLAFDVDEALKDDLAGFAVTYVSPDGRTHDVLNRLSFQHPITAGTTPDRRKFLPTREAPLQKFHWVHFPADVSPGTFAYRAAAMLFANGQEEVIEEGPSAEVSVELFRPPGEKFMLGFTRGYVSSQAYVDHFGHKRLEPEAQSIDYDTARYEAQYRWLGFHARRLIFDFLAEAVNDPSLSLDVFAYDLNEPDFIRQLAKLGPRLRLYLDDSHLHVDEGARELAAHQVLAAAAGADNVRVGHFRRFAHNKVLILKRGETALKVLSGSANFSVRGLYVQSNNVFVIDDEATAALYEQAFEQSWTKPHGFTSSEIASNWFELGGDGLPSFAVCFSPHRKASVSLDRVSAAVEGAKSSVFFAIMGLGGTGRLLDAIRALPDRKGIYAVGTTQNVNGALKVHGPDGGGTFVPFAFLSDKVPEPFKEEWSGGAGQVIHHKFVVVDFNDEDPVAYAGSSNLAAGGEEENGDNLVELRDRAIAVEYAVQAIQLIDHYRFRAVMRGATEAKPLRLKTRSEHWAADYFDPPSPKHAERTLFVR
jgi:PLD-like domain